MKTPSDFVQRLQRELSRRKLLGAGVLGLVSLALPSAPGCGASSGSGTTGSSTTTGGSTSGTGTGTSGSSGSGSSSGGTSGGCGAQTCHLDANTLVLDLSQHPDLAQPGGGLIVTDNRYSDPVCGGHAVVVVQPTAGQFKAFSAACTHRCCNVSVRQNDFFCPCHSSTFDFNGQVTQGPAQSPLPSLSVCTDGCKVYVQLA